MSVDEILKKAEALSPEERSKLVDLLLVSLHQPDPAIEDAWAAEIERRIAEIDSGTAELIPAEEVFAKYRNRR